jgi:hypothetical protein
MEALNGEPHRVVTIRPDVSRFADQYLTGGGKQLIVKVASACPTCPPPCDQCARPFDSQRVEALGYRNPDGHGGLLLKGNVWIGLETLAPYYDVILFTLQNVDDLTPDLDAEFREVMEAYGADPAALDTAEVEVFSDAREGRVELEGWAQYQVRLWVSPTTFLVGKMELGNPADDQTETLTFIDYGKVELPKPEPALLYVEQFYFFHEVQRRWAVLTIALEAYAASHGGLYPEEVSPAVLRDTLESEGLAWPLNAVTGEPMKETEDGNPGDFRYRAAPDRHCYFAHLYDWEGAPMPMYGGLEGSTYPIFCPEAEALFP